MAIQFVPIICQIKTRPEEIERKEEFFSLDDDGLGMIAIGWPGIGDLTGRSKEEIRTALEEVYSYENSYKLGHDLGVVNAFVNTIQTQSIVLVRDGESVWIGIAGQYRYSKEWDYKGGMPHQRPVKWIANVPRRELNAKVQTFIANRNIVSKFPLPFEDANLEQYLENSERMQVPRSRGGFSQEVIKKAREIVEDALNSSDPLLRQQAAIAILQQSKN